MISLVANHLWQSTLFAIVVAALVLALRNNSARLRYWLWMAASIKFVLPFSLLVSLGAEFAARTEWAATASNPLELEFPDDWASIASAVVQPATGFVESQQAAAQSVATNNWSLQTVLFGIWGAGVLCVIVVWAIRWLRLRSLLHRAKPLDLVAHRDIHFPAPIKFAPAKIEPGIVGIVRPILLLPQGLLERLTQQQVQAIFAHERCHLERRDNLTAAIHMLVQAIFWFHPIIWWVGSRLIDEREQACDAAVLKAGNDPEVYATGILDVCQHYVAAPLDCIAGVSGADLKKRVRSIMTHQGEARVHVMQWLLLVCVSMGLVVTPIFIGAVTASPAVAQQPNDDSSAWPAIESSTIALSQSDDPQNWHLLISPTGAYSSGNTTLRRVIAFAYRLQENEIVENSAALNDIVSTRFNIQSNVLKAASAKSVNEQQHYLAARRLLAEQFQLQFHFESQRVPTYALIVNNSNAGLKQASKEDAGPHISRGTNSVTGSAVEMVLLKQFLSSHLKRPIIDQTGLAGTYNFKLTWGLEPKEPNLSSERLVINDPSRDTLIDAVQRQLGLTLVSQDAEVKKMVIDRVQLPTTLKANPVEVQLPSAMLDRYAGYYDAPSNRTLRIVREGDRIFFHLTGQRPLQFFATSETEFFAKAAAVKATFVTSASGKVEALIVKQGAQEFRASPMNENAAIAREQLLAKRVRDNIAAPGSEDLLQKYFASLDADKPAYDLMTSDVAAAVRAEWPLVKARYVQNGPLKSLEFKKVSAAGADVYLATFENAQSEWSIGLDSQGKIDRLNYRRLARL